MRFLIAALIGIIAIWPDPVRANHIDAKAQAEFRAALEEAKKAEGNTLIGYDHQPNYAN